MIVRQEQNNFLSHYGILRKSGRYPWGSGEKVVDGENRFFGNAKNRTEVERSNAFLGLVADLRDQGIDDVTISKGFGMSTTELRDARTIAGEVSKQDRINKVVKLRHEKGLSTTAIGDKLGIPEATVRGLLTTAAKETKKQLTAIANDIRTMVDEQGSLDISLGVANHLGIKDTRLRSAVAILKEEGYQTLLVQSDQGAAGSNKTTFKVLARPDIEYVDLKKDPGKIGRINKWYGDGGTTLLSIQPPIPVSLKRIGINYKEDGGEAADGVIYVRPGVKDLSLDGKRYAQVRVQAGKDHYLKGMAIYKEGLPDGVDLVFNTNKAKADVGTADITKVMKPLKRVGKMPDPRDPKGKPIDDPDTPVDVEFPFGAVVRQVKKRDKYGAEIPDTVASALNIVNEEGDWQKWRKSISTQVLSKQPPTLAMKQLALTRERTQASLDEILALTNPVVKKKLLDTFADETDSSAVDLAAANLPKQASHVIMPVNSLKPSEVHAPNHNNGDQVALIRFPHGGTFEIPVLTVNNKNKEALSLLGDAPDAIGINHKVAQQLSGADFDGDTVLVIPQTATTKLNATPPLKQLAKFNPQEEYKAPPGVKFKTTQTAMGDISNLITDMTIKGATDDKIARAVKHSMVIIDADKHNLNWKKSEVDNGIRALKEEFQGKTNAGAATLISRATSMKRVNEVRPRKASDIPVARNLKEKGFTDDEIAAKMTLTVDSVKSLLNPRAKGGPVDPTTGEKVFLETGRGYTRTRTNLKTGEVTETFIKNLSVFDKLAYAKDARDLLSDNGGTAIEKIYADHSNALKAMANQARRESLAVKTEKMNPSAKKAYAKEVEELDAQLNLVLLNKPLQRQAVALASSTVMARRAANPDMEKEEIKKLERSALKAAQDRTGAKKTRVEITDRQWEAIQAGAISPKKLGDILDATDIERVKELATPRTKLAVSNVMLQRATQMKNNGATQAEIAAQLGVPLGTLKDALY